MADLVTHLSVGVLLKAATRGPHTAIFLAGTIIPDLSRLPAMVFSALNHHVDIPPVLLYGWGPLHMPAGMILTAWLLALLLPEDIRRAGFGNLLAGMGLHLALDLLQSHLGVGYALLFPFHNSSFELGWIGSEATVPFALPLAALAWLVWRWRRPPSTTT